MADMLSRQLRKAGALAQECSGCILIEGQGRWRMHAQEPGDMWIKYRQAKVEEKRTVSDL